MNNSIAKPKQTNKIMKEIRAQANVVEFKATTVFSGIVKCNWSNPTRAIRLFSLGACSFRLLLLCYSVVYFSLPFAFFVYAFFYVFLLFHFAYFVNLVEVCASFAYRDCVWMCTFFFSISLSWTYPREVVTFIIIFFPSSIRYNEHTK